MAATPRSAIERDPVKLDHRHYKVESETGLFRVVRVTYGPYEKSPMHLHAPGVGVLLTDGDFKFTYTDGRTEELHMRAGQFIISDQSWEHQQENLSGKSFEALMIELKR